MLGVGDWPPSSGPEDDPVSGTAGPSYFRYPRWSEACRYLHCAPPCGGTYGWPERSYLAEVCQHPGFYFLFLLYILINYPLLIITQRSEPCWSTPIRTGAVCVAAKCHSPQADGSYGRIGTLTTTGFLSACLRWLLWVVRASPTLVAWNQLHLALHSPTALLCRSHDMDYILTLLSCILFRAWGRIPRRPPHRAAGQRPGPAGVAPL